MRILLATPVYYEQSGGPMKVVRSLAKELAKRHQVSVYTTSAIDKTHDFDKSVKRVESNGHEIVYFPRIPFITDLNISLSMAISIKKNLKNYDIIHVHSWRQFQDMIIHHYAKKYKIPYVINTHGSLRRGGTKKWRKWFYDVLFGYNVLKDAGKVIASNKIEVNEQITWGISKDNIEILPNGIDLLEYEHLSQKGEFKKEFLLNKNEKIILYVGRMHESKGLDLLVKAFSIVLEELDDVSLVFVGPDDGYKLHLDELISDLEITEKTLFTGFISKKMKLAAFVDSDVFVTPKFHSFPTAFLEACLVGCPIVTTTGELDWIHEKIGFVTKESPIALADAIMKILCTEEIQIRFKDNCKSTIINFEISNVVSQLEKIYTLQINR